MNKRNFPLGSIVLIIGMGMLFSGPMLKKKDPIQKTQTDPIKYEDKMKEIEAGPPKGAPRPSFRYYFKRLFMVEFPFFKEKQKPTKSLQLEDSQEVTEIWSEDVQEQETSQNEDDWWFEQWDNKDNN